MQWHSSLHSERHVCVCTFCPDFWSPEGAEPWRKGVDLSSFELIHRAIRTSYQGLIHMSLAESGGVGRGMSWGRILDQRNHEETLQMSSCENFYLN